MNTTIKPLAGMVPAHAGGVDLSRAIGELTNPMLRPRPCGRGGFKRVVHVLNDRAVRPRPCGRGGFKLVFWKSDRFARVSPPMRAGWI